MSDDAATKADHLRRLAAERETFAMLSGIFEAARLIPSASQMPDVALPLTVISGFLGAGKTTLVNRLLTEPHGRRIAVLVNDFGAINIDEELIRSRSADAIGLTNGCACCSVAGDLTKALLKLVQQEQPPDAIVLEASGLADPHGIAQVALANPAIRLDGVLTLVDGETLIDRADDPDTQAIVASQIASADLIVLNKTDLIDPAQQPRVQARLRELAGDRTIVEVSHSAVPADVVLGIKASHSGFQCAAEGHAAAFASWNRAWDAPLDRARLTEVLERLPAHIIRAKGVFHFAGEPGQRFIYPRVGRRGGFEPQPQGAGAGRSQLVVIGAQFGWDEAAVAALFSDVATTSAA
jgi:G3E family GTPase